MRDGENAVTITTTTSPGLIRDETVNECCQCVNEFFPLQIPRRAVAGGALSLRSHPRAVESEQSHVGLARRLRHGQQTMPFAHTVIVPAFAIVPLAGRAGRVAVRGAQRGAGTAHSHGRGDDVARRRASARLDDVHVHLAAY